MRWRAALLVGLLVGAACQAGPPPPTVVIANAPGTLSVGEVRLLIGLLGEEGSPVGGFDTPATVRLFDADSGDEVSATPGDFIWTVPNLRGLYVANVEIPRSGVWGVAVEVDGTQTEVVGVEIRETTTVPSKGDPAPRSVTPTGDEFPLAEISSDPSPNPQLYDRSLHEVLGSGASVVAVFSTPAFCFSASCGPTLEIVKEVAENHEDVEFVHIEVYTNLDAPSIQELELAPAVLEWQLPSEPWVFVMDGSGVVVKAFEGALSPEELVSALASAR